MKAVICAIAKFEYNYIYEWVEYHLNLGFDKIIIYDNNDLDGERYDELLSKFIKKGQVELRDVRGKRAMQRVVYNKFYHEGDFDWVANIDIDEFISPNKLKYKDIKEFLSKYKNTDAIYLYWQTYGDAGKTYPTKSSKPISLLEQYSVPAEENSLIDDALKIQNAWGKSIIRKGLPIKFLHEHFVVDPSNLKYSDCFGNDVNPYLYYPDRNFVKTTYTECFIKHIYTKSLYEYIDCKVRRPAANTMGIMHFPEKYFKVNEINEEKRKYLESIGYKMTFTFRPDVYAIIEVRNLDEYYKLKPYIINIIELCSCRFNLKVTEDPTATNVISNELAGLFNECSIYFEQKYDVISGFFEIYHDIVQNIVDHTNCVVHLSIPYGVNLDEYISSFIHPLFCKENIKNNFTKVLSSTDTICISKTALFDAIIDSEPYKNFKKICPDITLEKVIYTGSFIAKTVDVIKYKEKYEKIKDKLDPETMLYFVSSMFSTFYSNNK